MPRILVVEDDPKLNRLFCTVLQREGYAVTSALDGAQALDAMDRERFDLVVTDLMMPGVDGFGLVEMLRQAAYHLPVLVVTAKDQFADKERGFVLGIDDYMVKPVDVKEMQLRVKALLRRASVFSERRVCYGTTVLDNDALTLSIDGIETLLPQKEFQLLYKLASYPNKVFTRQQLMDEFWGFDTETDERTVDVHVNRIRERLAASADIRIVTVRGLGYKAVCGG